jgi:hypothetical protein
MTTKLLSLWRLSSKLAERRAPGSEG